MGDHIIRRAICSLFLLFIALVMAACKPGDQTVAKLPAEDKKILQQSSYFHDISAVSNLPPAVRRLSAEINGNLADRGQTWEPTDVITNPNLPRHRLIWAATDRNYYVAHYETGGRAHSFYVLVARIRPGDVEPASIWSGCGKEFKDFNSFAEHLREGN